MAARVLFPETGFTTEDAVAYYRAMTRVILPHLRNRPLSFKRYPGTIRLESFWEKDAPSLTPKWVTKVPGPRRSDELSFQSGQSCDTHVALVEAPRGAKRTL